MFFASWGLDSSLTSTVLFIFPSRSVAVGRSGAWRHLPSTKNLYWCRPRGSLAMIVKSLPSFLSAMRPAQLSNEPEIAMGSQARIELVSSGGGSIVWLKIQTLLPPYFQRIDTGKTRFSTMSSLLMPRACTPSLASVYWALTTPCQIASTHAKSAVRTHACITSALLSKISLVFSASVPSSTVGCVSSA